MESLVFFILWLLVGTGILAIAWLFAGVTTPQRDYSDDWRGNLP